MILTSFRRVLVSAPKEAVVSFLRDIPSVARCDKKIRSVEVLNMDADTADVALSGNLMGFPWHGVFRFEFQQDGSLRAWNAENPKAVSFAFRLRPSGGATELIHEEQYRLPVPLWPLKPWVGQWLEGTIERELWLVKEGAEALNRRRQLQQLETPA